MADQQAGREVVLIQPPRLEFHPMIEERFGIDRAAWRALTDAVWPAAKTTDAVVLALSYCKARKLDPFKRVVHIVPIWDRDKQAYVETVWPGIAEHRTTAFRTKQYAGADAAVFGETIEQAFSGETRRGAVNVTLKFPAWAQLTVYRMIDGQRVPVPGPRVYWLETYSTIGRTEVPNEMWQKRPFGQIEKCAEAAALRRAFPEELGDEPTQEEAGAYQRGGGDGAKDVTPVAEPRRADFAKPEPPKPPAKRAARPPEPKPEPKPSPAAPPSTAGAAETSPPSGAPAGAGVAPAGGADDEPFDYFDAQGEPQAFGTPLQFATRIIADFDALKNDAERERIIDNNREEAARALPLIAQTTTGWMIADLFDLAFPAAPLMLTERNGKPDWTAFAQRAGEVLAIAGSVAMVDAFMAANAGVLAQASAGIRNSLNLQASRRKVEIEPPEPPEDQ
jgi:phage recombination protein Bet